MLSIIICNYHKSRLSSINQNITEKIGDIEFEIIIIDNSENTYSIFEAYNIGVNISRGQHILFIHDDIEIKTKDFGKILISLDLPHLGVLGIAGSKIKTKVIAPWWISNHEKVPNGVLFQWNIQHFKNEEKKNISVGFEYINQIEEAILVDGVFLYTKRNNCLESPFDESYNSFHFYDLDFSMTLISKGKRNYVCNLIQIEHFSSGSLNKDWLRSASLFHKKWPKEIYYLNDKKGLIKYEKLAFNSILKVAIDNKSYLFLLNVLISFFRFFDFKKNISTLRGIFYG